MSEDVLLVDRSLSGCAVLTLNRPQHMNALSKALRGALVSAIDTLAQDPAVRVLVLTGAGRAFSAGLDLKELTAHANSLDALAPGDVALDPVAALARFPGPVIAAVNGVAVTGGFELALACDLILVSPQARFSDTHGRVGIMPFWGLSQKLSRIVGVGRAKWLSFTGNFLEAEMALQWGLAQQLVPADRLVQEALALAASILESEPQTLVGYKRLIDDGLALPLGAALELERERGHAAARQTDLHAIAQRRQGLRERGRVLSR